MSDKRWRSGFAKILTDYDREHLNEITEVRAQRTRINNPPYAVVNTAEVNPSDRGKRSSTNIRKKPKRKP